VEFEGSEKFVKLGEPVKFGQLVKVVKPVSSVDSALLLRSYNFQTPPGSRHRSTELRIHFIH
jgi:hypothetical protein